MLGKAHGVLYKAPAKKERKSGRLRGNGDNNKFIGLRFERGQVVTFGKGRLRQDILRPLSSLQND